MQEWSYKSETYSSTGYEDLYPVLDTYTKDRYINASKVEQDQMVEEIFNIYRSRNIFPIIYYNNDGIRGEILKAIESEPHIVNDVIKGSGDLQSCVTFSFPTSMTPLIFMV